LERKKRRIQVQIPTDLSDLLWLASERPKAYLMAGGTGLMARSWPDGLPSPIIDLKAATELDRISRTERWLDIGATLSLSRIISVGSHVVPEVLYSAIAGIGGPPLRNLATLGGNLCQASLGADAIPPLMALESRVEIRSVDGASWMPISDFIRGQRATALEPGQLVTRIRIPLARWDQSLYRKVSMQRSPSTSIIAFCALARLQKDSISQLRLTVAGVFAPQPGGPVVFRGRDLEVALVGHRLPLTPRAISHFEQALSESIAAAEGARPPDSYQVRTATRLFGSFLEQLGRP
jgi:CO/xanthine dehydrogenase FAD-binding subunit